MKNCIPRMLTVCLLGILFSPLYAQPTVGDDMLKALRENNAQLLTAHFADQVELSILGQGSLSNTVDAHQTLSAFFLEYPVESCQVLHHGQRAQSEFYILSLGVSEKQVFRVYALLRAENSKQLIQQFRIDEAYE